MKTETNCPYVATFDLIGGKWTSCLLRQIGDAPRGFNELARLTAPLSPKVLAQRLRQFEAEALITRRVIPSNPPASEYSIAPLGRDLLPLMDQIESWGRRYLGSDTGKAA